MRDEQFHDLVMQLYDRHRPRTMAAALMNAELERLHGTYRRPDLGMQRLFDRCQVNR